MADQLAISIQRAIERGLSLDGTEEIAIAVGDRLGKLNLGDLAELFAAFIPYQSGYYASGQTTPIVWSVTPTPASALGNYLLGVYLAVTTYGAGDAVTVTATWTDEDGNNQSFDLIPIGQLVATISAAGKYSFGATVINELFTSPAPITVTVASSLGTSIMTIAIVLQGLT